MMICLFLRHAVVDYARWREGFKQSIPMLRSGIPDFHAAIDDVVAEGDIDYLNARGDLKVDFLGLDFRLTIRDCRFSRSVCQMNNNVILMAEFSIKSGELDNFKALVKEMVEATQANEPDTIIYEIFISEDGKSCQIMERYVDSAAAMTHLGNFGEKFGDRPWAFLEPKGFKVCGNPSNELKEAVSGVGAMILTPVGGFAR